MADRLSEIYGRRIDVRYALDPSIRGGLVVRVGDEVIDGSLSPGSHDVRAAFARLTATTDTSIQQQTKQTEDH